MTGKELYEMWAPPTDEWSPWVKPVLFAEIDESVIAAVAPGTSSPFSLRDSVGFRRDTALVVDLPGPHSLTAGFGLAQDGYRPVPLYNTTSGRQQGIAPSQCMLTDVGVLVQMLATPPSDSIRRAISGHNPPAFLLDARRLRGEYLPAPGRYDNRWMVFPQDFPSARFLQAQGITQVVVIQEKLGLPADDLAHVLLRWKEGGLALFVQDTEQRYPPRPLEIPRPSNFRSMLYRALALLGLRRNSAGGFGAVIPLPGQGGGFG